MLQKQTLRHMKEEFERTARVIGEEGIATLAKARVLVFGVGGVGSYVCEGLARAGIGTIYMVDKDTVDITNINRQIPALHSTIGRSKAEVMAERIADINPDCSVTAREMFFMPAGEDRAACGDDIDFSCFDYVVDAVDNITAKLHIIERAVAAGVPLISSMGTGNKLNAGMFRITTIEKTKVCPLAKVMRKELRNRGIEGIKVLYSEEEPKDGEDGQRIRGGSISFVPSVGGLLIAGEVVRDLLR